MGWPTGADNGDLEHDLQALLEAVGLAAQNAGNALVMFVDELQYVAEEELAALITALHRAAQRQLPVTLVGAGLPQLRGRMWRAKSYAELISKGMIWSSSHGDTAFTVPRFDEFMHRIMPGNDWKET